MKNFKKAISLVLVFAMLASFAGMTGYKYSPMSIEAHAAYGSNDLQYNVPSTTDKPYDSLSGLNELTQFDVPSVLYRNGSSIINSITSVVSTEPVPLNTKISITFPSKATSATLYLVSWGENGKGGQYGQDDDVVLKTIPLTISGGKATYDMVNAGTLDSEFTSGGYICYRLDYVCTVSHIDEDGNKYSNNTTATYTQYATSVLKEIPQYKAVWQAGTRRLGCDHFNDHSDYPNVNGGYTFSTYNTMDFSSVLGVVGTNIRTSVRSDDGAFCTEDTYAFSGAIDFAGSHDSGFKNSDKYSLGFFWWPGTIDDSDNEKRNFVGAQQSSGTKDNDTKDSYETVGGAIYYDKDLVSSLTLGVNFAKTSVKGSSSHTAAAIVEYYESWFTKSKFDGKEISGKANGTTYPSGNSGWTEIGANGITSLDQIKYTNKSASSGSTVSGVSGSGNVNGTTTSATRTYTFTNLKGATSGKYLQLVTELCSDWYHKFKQFFGNVKDHWLYADQIMGWHVDLIPRDRSASRTLKNNAVAYNYIKDEMDPEWWREYRKNVLNAYFNLGSLESEGNPLDITDSYQNNPVYEGIDYNELYAEIYASGATPKYERGSVNDNAESSWYKKGSEYAATVDYTNTLRKDGSGADYTSASDGGNGVNNLTSAALYRYMGAYFYTPETWQTYATLRFDAVNLLNYPQSTRGILKNSFGYGHSQANFTGYHQTSLIHEAYGSLRAGLACYKQAEIDQMVDDLKAAKQALDNGSNYLTLAGFKMRNDYDGGGAWVVSNGTQVIGYSAIIAYLDSLIPREKFTYYSGLKDSDGDGFMDTLVESEKQLYDTTELETALANLKNQYKAEDTVISKGIAFEAEIKAFLQLVKETKDNPVRAENDIWKEIFKFINTTLADKYRPSDGIIANGFADAIERIAGEAYGVYTLTEAQKNNFNALITTYNTAADPDSNNDYKSKKKATEQGPINDAVNSFFEALKQSFPSLLVSEAATNALAVPNAPGSTFEVYAPEQNANKQYSKYDPTSIGNLQTKVAEDLAGNSFQFNKTKWSTIDMLATTISNRATFENEGKGGQLRQAYVVTEHMNTALAKAESYITPDKLTQTLTSPSGETVEWSYYTAQSVAELQYVIDQAKKVDAEQPYENQLAVDKLTFALYDEADDSIDNLLTSDWPVAPRVWAYDDNGMPTGYTDGWGASIFATNLYGDRLAAANGTDEGLKPNTAYYEFLIKELSTPYTSDGITVDGGKLWDAETGWIKVGADGKVPVDSGIFNETWGQYVTACNTALELYNAYKNGTPLTVDRQEDITKAAQAVYDTRNALQLLTFKFDKDDMYDDVQAIYNNTLLPLIQKVSVMRYGYEYVLDENGERTGAIQPSADLKSSAAESVYLYNNITPELEALIDRLYVEFASNAPTANFGAWGTEDQPGEGLKLYKQILALTASVTPKSSDDASLVAGMEDLKANYIAGVWSPSTQEYTSDLLNKDQVGKLDEMLTEAQNYITPAANATADRVASLMTETTKIFNYTTAQGAYQDIRATDLQFAEYMREEELYKFMELTVSSTVPYYYGGTYEIPMFNEVVVAQYKSAVENFFSKLEWPCIYEINGLKWSKGDTDHAASITGYGYENGTYTGSVDAVVQILNRVGSRSPIYAMVAAQANTFNVDPYNWLCQNAFKVIPGTYSDANKRGDETVLSKYTLAEGETYPKAYNAGANWYTEGYAYYTDGGKGYYLYNSNANGTWFTDIAAVEAFREGASASEEMPDYTIGTMMSDSQLYFMADMYVYDFGYYYYTDYLNDYGWSPKDNEGLVTWAELSQSTYDKYATALYDQLCVLQLRPATDAYRDVYNTYLGIMGQHIDDSNWLEGSFSHAKLDENEKELISDVDFKFYNVGQASKLPDNIKYNIPDGAVPPYGIVSRSQYGSFLTQYTTTEEYADKTNNPWYNLVYSLPGSKYHNPDSFINKFISTPEEDMITIDQAAKVNSYNVGTADDDDYKSIMETLIDDYLSKLEFDDLVFDKLDAVVAAFLGDKLPEVLGDGEGSISAALRQEGFIVGEHYGGKFYPLSYYTDKSLLEVAGILRSNNVLKDGVIIEKIINEDGYKWIGETFPLPITYGVDYKGSFYTSTTDQNKIDSSNPDHNSMLLGFLNALNKQLILRPVKIAKENINEQRDYLTEALSAAAFAKENEAKYDTNHTSWKTFEAEYANAQGLLNDHLENKDKYNITDQEHFDNQTSALLKAIENLKDALIADNYAPSMTLKTSVGGVKDFYSKAAYAVQLSTADPESYKGAGEKPEEKANPAAGTFFVPNSSGYSLIVYTNELNPRIVINLEDLEQKLADGTNGGAAVMQDAAKKEFISINAVRTSGVETNVIAGTIVPAQKENPETMSVLPTEQATSNSAVTVENASTVKGSSAFAILAPKFVKDTATQAALYTIEARDGSVRSTETGTVNGNNADKFEFGGAGQEPVNIVKDNNGKIAIYIYYYSLKAKDGTDEGINADGSALATPAINGTHVPSALLSGEPGFKGTDWRNGILLQRHFSDSHRVWEYVSEVKKNENNQYSVNGTIGVPVYNDPNFGYLNTGSFYYVLDKNAGAETVDGKVIAEYNSGNNSVAGCMDYDRATAAKTAMIDAINAMTETEFAVMKKSGRFYNYGDYETDEFGNVLYNGDEPKWINWAQSLNNKVENGDLVFVHVVDRWGNVVNRIVEITNLDENAPKVSSDAAGAVAITEKGGSGITDIQVHNGDFSLGEFEYQVSQSQNVKLENGQIANKAEVNCASNVLTIVNLVPGKTYYIGAEDNAGNRGTTAVKADANGHIVITINNEIVQTGEDMSIEGNSSIFTLNGTDTIILNSGEASSVIDATMKGNVFANYIIRHYITTKDNVTALKTVNQDGTVEEWTADNATVKDNGDGTVKWTIKRKLAEGEHSYKVYAKVNGEYENFYVPATITATTRTVKLTYTVVGMGKTVMEHSGAASAKNSTYKSTTVPYGSYVTITADTNVEGCEFYYWINNTTDRITSTANVYEFKAVTDIDCVAQFTNGSTYYDGKKLVVYVNNAKNVIERFELADGDNYTVPTGPVLPDYTFKGWSMTKAEVLESEKDTVIVEPIYELNASNTVTITEGNYTATGAGTYKAEDNQRAVVTISTSAKDGDGKEFLYWIDADTDEIVSYDRTYTFFCVKDTELTPVYGDASTVKAEPIARITEVKFNALSGKVSFFAERSVPEEYMILQTGIVVTKTESIGTNEDVFVVGGASTAAGTSTSTANNGYYSANTAVATGQTVWARAYVIYETADGEIFEAYGPVVSYTVD